MVIVVGDPGDPLGLRGPWEGQAPPRPHEKNRHPHLTPWEEPASPADPFERTGTQFDPFGRTGTPI